MNFNLSRLWSDIVRVFKILSVANISIFAVIISWLCLFNVAQVTDAIIALGDFGSLHHFVIFILAGLLWAFFIWYWARVFYFIEYKKRKDLKNYEEMIVKYTPRVLGTIVLLIVGLAFLVQAPKCQISNGLNPIRVIGIIYVALAILFSIFVNIRRKIFMLKPLDELHESLEPHKGIVKITNLPDTTIKILSIASIVTSILLILITIWPIHLTMLLGDGVTVLILCLCIWLPLLYWIRYFSLKLGFPLFLLLTIIILCFSSFNSNKNIRLISLPSDTRMNIGDYTAAWLDKASKVKNTDNSELLESNKDSDTRTPMVIVLSEGGGIRASYWSAQFLARVQKEYPDFRDYLYCISGVSGGSFGATVFDGILNYYDHLPQEAQGTDFEGKNAMQRKITDIIGKDFLSPTIACLFTRELIQLLVPFPIESFDRAKVFEGTWEYVWENSLNNDQAFHASFLSLWNKNTLPALFINTTQVENGFPVVLSNIKLNNSQEKNITRDKLNFPRDFYADILKEPYLDVPLSTASLLSARFPFVSPAGTLTGKNGTISLVDGGYFDNTGANTAYQVLFDIKKWYQSKHKDYVFHTKIKPIIVYLTNGINVPDKINSSRTLMGQLSAPIETSFQIRDSNTKNNLLKLKDYVEFYGGEFITYSLQKPGATETDIPLGWALSRKVQKEIDLRVEEIDIKELVKYIK